MGLGLGTLAAMLVDSSHIATTIDRSPEEVYDFVSDPRNLPAWAAGLADHDVTLPSGEVVTNPLRVVPNGSGCDVIFTVHRRVGMSPAEFAADIEAVSADLATLRARLEHR